MHDESIHAVTGAFGYTGKYITHRLLAAGQKVITLTNSVNRENPFGDRITAYPFNFDHPQKLIESLRGVSVLYNTYWIRFNHKQFTQTDAVRNTLTLFDAAAKAGVRRIVHISIANPAEDSPLEYYRNKALLEKALQQSRTSWAILRPTVLFGKEDILINNIAWTLRHFPLVPIFGFGNYHIQPVYVDDLAELAVEQAHSNQNNIINAVGPETFKYKNLLRLIGKAIGKKRILIPVPPPLGYLGSRLTGLLVNDIIVTRAEITGLMNNLLCVDTPPPCKTRLTDWIKDHAHTLGKKYAGELSRRKNRQKAYQNL
ncbi:MAG: NAD(P)H-binding protein [Sedimentisphaerales bacterium]|nr:NAD(P)H-binding protein [Sedimentisphaerales bacterium]